MIFITSLKSSQSKHRNDISKKLDKEKFVRQVSDLYAAPIRKLSLY
jgi:hypothetical protein